MKNKIVEEKTRLPKEQVKKAKETNEKIRSVQEERVRQIENNLKDKSRQRLRRRDQERVAERMHDIIERLIRSSKNDQDKKLTREDIACRAFGKNGERTGPFAGRLRRFEKDPGEDKADLIQRADKYYPLVDTLVTLGVSREDVLMNLFGNTALDMTQEELAHWELGEWLSPFVDFMNRKAEEIGDKHDLATYFKQVNAYSLWCEYTNRLMPKFESGQHESGDPRGRISRGFLPLASIKKRSCYPFLLYGFMPMVPLYYVPIADPVAVQVRMSKDTFRAGDFSAESLPDDFKRGLVKQAESADPVDVEVYACCTIGLALAPVDDNGRTSLLFEFVNSSLIALKGSERGLYIDQSTFFSDYVKGERYFLAAVDHGHVTEDAPVRLILFNNDTCPDRFDRSSEIVFDMGDVIYSPFDIMHCHKYLIDLPINEPKIWHAFKESESSKLARIFPSDTLGTLLEENIYQHDEHSILKQLDVKAGKLVEALREFKQRNAEAVEKQHALISFTAEDEE